MCHLYPPIRRLQIHNPVLFCHPASATACSTPRISPSSSTVPINRRYSSSRSVSWIAHCLRKKNRKGTGHPRLSCHTFPPAKVSPSVISPENAPSIRNTFHNRIHMADQKPRRVEPFPKKLPLCSAALARTSESSAVHSRAYQIPLQPIFCLFFISSRIRTLRTPGQINRIPFLVFHCILHDY